MNYRYTISCLRCGILMQWSLGEGDKNPEANLTKLHEKLSAHQRITRGHVLRFKKEVLQSRGSGAKGQDRNKATSSLGLEVK